MHTTLIRSAVGVACLAALLALAVSTAAAENEYSPAPHPIYMAAAGHQGDSALKPPPICCVPGIESLTGKLPIPDLGNMAYFGGHVQVQPKVYLVFWGWGQAGAFDHTTPGFPASDPTAPPRGCSRSRRRSAARRGPSRRRSTSRRSTGSPPISRTRSTS